MTIADARIEKAQNRGEGGCGYLFEVTASNEILIRDSIALEGRHAFIQNWDFGTTGVVFLRVEAGGSRSLRISSTAVRSRNRGCQPSDSATTRS